MSEHELPARLIGRVLHVCTPARAHPLFQRIFVRNLGASPSDLPSILCNNTDIYTLSPPSLLFIGTTLTEPIHSLQHNNNSDIRSRMLMSVLRSATSSSHPSGINPSKNGNSIGLTNVSVCNGSVKLTGSASPRLRYASS